jgi:formylglycine-generating enzyme required for sulfatase activity
MLRLITITAACLLLFMNSAECADQPKPLKAPFTKEEAKAAQEAWAKHLGKKVEEEIDIGGGLKMVFVLIPPGTFQMGSPEAELKLEGDDKAKDNEIPQHEMTITKPFYLDKYTVTQAEYVQLTEKENPSAFSANGDFKERVTNVDTSRFPVEQVSWKDAVAYASALEKKLGAGWVKARLPSEAMWEYACRAGTETRWHVGNHLTRDDENFGKNVLTGRTRPVGEGTANSFGLYDMHGNVCQWCSSGHEKYLAAAQTDPDPAGDDSARAIRGGSWDLPPHKCRSADRGKGDPANWWHFSLGFRLALVPSGQDK